jgi:hypothetical protein
VTGLQCHKRLWWTVHEPGAPEIQPDEALQARFDRGTQVGLVARTHVPGGVLIEGPYHAYAERIAATDSALRRGAGRLLQGVDESAEDGRGAEQAGPEIE